MEMSQTNFRPSRKNQDPQQSLAFQEGVWQRATATTWAVPELIPHWMEEGWAPPSHVQNPACVIDPKVRIGKRINLMLIQSQLTFLFQRPAGPYWEDIVQRGKCCNRWEVWNRKFRHPFWNQQTPPTRTVAGQSMIQVQHRRDTAKLSGLTKGMDRRLNNAVGTGSNNTFQQEKGHLSQKCKVQNGKESPSTWIIEALSISKCAKWLAWKTTEQSKASRWVFLVNLSKRLRKLQVTQSHRRHQITSQQVTGQTRFVNCKQWHHPTCNCTSGCATNASTQLSNLQEITRFGWRHFHNESVWSASQSHNPWFHRANHPTMQGMRAISQTELASDQLPSTCQKHMFTWCDGHHWHFLPDHVSRHWLPWKVMFHCDLTLPSAFGCQRLTTVRHWAKDWNYQL